VTTLESIFGQHATVETLERAYRADRLPHGMIFAGPAGVGKATTARALATLFLCENPKDGKPCGKCASCAVMSVLNRDGTTNHPDFHVIYRQLIRLEKSEAKARDLPAAIIRDYVVAPAGRKAMMNRGKVFVIREAELMNATAQNSLLKTLEEPPGRTLIILLTDQPHALLQTIRSRCQTIPFAALDEKLVAKELEKRKVAKTLATEAAQFSEGSLGVALRWIEDGVVELARELNTRIDALAAGKNAADLADFFKKAADAYAEKQLERDEKASKDQATKEGLGLYLKLAANRFRQKLAESKHAERLEQLCMSIDAIARAENYLDSNVNAGLTLQQLAVSLHRDLAGAA
jgi:DNA polymerase-3 subunit delta'